MPRLLPLALALCVAPALARADEAGFAERLDEQAPSVQESPAESGSVELSGSFRLRGEALYNLDLDRGLTPSGAPLFPVPLGSADGQTLTGANMRLRTDLRMRGPGTGISVVLRTDVLDNLSLGSTPIGRPPDARAATPAGSPGQDVPGDTFRIKRAYAEAVTPLGILSAGRMGNQWGLGMVANGGDCEDCDGGDAADRVAFVSPLLGHVWALAYDIGATGPLTKSRDSNRSIDLEPTDDVQTLTFAVQTYRSPMTRHRRLRAGLVNFGYGTYLSHRWQDNDVPGDYLGASSNMAIVTRDFRATIADLWLRLESRRARIEFEGAYLRASSGNSSLVPGVSFYEGVESSQWGSALQSELWLGGIRVGLDAGIASGDPSPGFGAFPDPNAGAAQPGDLDGAQANPPFDNRIDNFRFHSDYRIDRILFREIIGTVTDAAYVRPHLRVPIVETTTLNIRFEMAAIASWAMEPSSTPGGSRALGVEVDPSLRYESDDGFVAVLEQALFVPLGGFDNAAAGLDAKSAQLWRLRLEYPF